MESARQRPNQAAPEADALLPTEFGDFRIRAFRDPADGKEHAVLYVGDLTSGSPLVRVHSECLTGEVLGSLKCDCKPQLLAALAYIAERGRGAVAYLRQEGRGIGLGNKIRAYRLQEDGYDTVDANRELGFGDDLRQYDMAAEMIAAAGIESVELMTNNPLKIEGLKAEGIPVVGRIEISVGENSVNTDYLETKRVRMGHMLDEDRPVTRIKRTQKPRLALA